MAPRIRPFRPGDLPAVRLCVVALQDAERALDTRLRPGAAITAPYCDALLARSAAEAGAIFVAEIDGEIAGFAAVQARVPFLELDEPPGSYALLSDLVVLPPHRGRGLGRALLDAAAAHARAQGAAELRLGVLAGNAAARALYGAAGFRPYLETWTKELGA
jgi:ribosomal protein S18 acetylase RimI-like enzyme